MTRGEAINWLINISADIGKREHKDLWHYEQALFEIREMLEAQTETDKIRWERDTAIQQLADLGYGLGEKPRKDDCISRQAAIDAVVTWTAEDRPDIEMPTDLVARINALPSAQPEREKGRWIEVEVFPESYDIEGVKTWSSEMQCDQCGFRHTAIEGHMAQYNYCPNCGSYNGGEQE